MLDNAFQFSSHVINTNSTLARHIIFVKTVILLSFKFDVVLWFSPPSVISLRRGRELDGLRLGENQLQNKDHVLARVF